MAVTIEQLTKDALTLSEAERADLAYNLLLSLGPEPDDDVEEAWEEEIARRVAEVHNGTAKGRPVEEVFEEIRLRRGGESTGMPGQ